MARTQSTKKEAPRVGSVPIRHMDFTFDEASMSTYCWDENAFSSAFIFTFSLLIPYGERFVIESVRHYQDRIRDPELKARVRGLIGQEAMHSRVHQEFNAVYAQKGIRIDRIQRLGHWYFEEHLPSILPPSAQLAVTCAIEHFTAMMADRAFRHPEDQEKIDLGAREFLLWHVLEEAEHKSVAYDLYQEQVGSHLLRTWALGFIVSYASLLFAFSMQEILRAPGFAQGPRETLQGAAYWFGSRGYFADMRPRMLQYLRPDFHPDQVLTDEALAEWTEHHFGEGGILAHRVEKTVVPRVRQPAAAGE